MTPGNKKNIMQFVKTYATNSHVPTTISWNWKKYLLLQKDAVAERSCNTQPQPPFFGYVRSRQPVRSHYCAHKSQCRTFRCETICWLSFSPDSFSPGVHPYSAHFRSSLHLRVHNKSTHIPLCLQSPSSEKRRLPRRDVQIRMSWRPLDFIYFYPRFLGRM